jgi:hypothetical protein
VRHAMALFAGGPFPINGLKCRRGQEMEELAAKRASQKMQGENRGVPPAALDSGYAFPADA